MEKYQDKYNKEYNIKNKQKQKEYNTQYKKDRYHNDPLWKLQFLLRSRFNNALRTFEGEKFTSVINLVGCSIKECRLYIENQFLPVFNWGNWGEIWEIDHIIPISKFDLTDLEQQKQCFHYTNLKPRFKTTELAKQYGYLNEIGNRDKSDKII